MCNNLYTSNSVSTPRILVLLYIYICTYVHIYTHNIIQLNQKKKSYELIHSSHIAQLHYETLHSDKVRTRVQLAKDKSDFYQGKIVAHFWKKENKIQRPQS